MRISFASTLDGNRSVITPLFYHEADRGYHHVPSSPQAIMDSQDGSSLNDTALEFNPWSISLAQQIRNAVLNRSPGDVVEMIKKAIALMNGTESPHVNKLAEFAKKELSDRGYDKEAQEIREIIEQEAPSPNKALLPTFDFN